MPRSLLSVILDPKLCANASCLGCHRGMIPKHEVLDTHRLSALGEDPSDFASPETTHFPARSIQGCC